MKEEMMNPMIVTKETGAKTMPLGMAVAEPACQVTGAQLMTFADDVKGNSIFLANLVSAFSAHERCGLHLYRTAAGMTRFEEWRAKYEEFGEQTAEHIRILAELTTQLGGDPMYVSPQARMTEFCDAKLMEAILLAGSVDILTMELTTLEAVFLAEQKCHANWALLKTLAGQMTDSPARRAIEQAVTQVEDQEDEHVRWAEQTLKKTLMAQIGAGLATSGGKEVA
jgi:rubrerythrin